MKAILTFWQSGKPTGEFVNCQVKKIDPPKYTPTASGYSGKIPTEYMVKYNGRWRRVYAACYSNCGTLYIGTLGNPWVATVEIDGQ